jgi:alpha-D-xyloside xylohydrolase
MRKQSNYLWLLIWLAMSFEISSSDIWAAVETLESSALRIELNTHPYSFRVLERSTGDVLVSQSHTSFSRSRYCVTDAADITRTSDTMRATLSLAGTADKAQVTLAFASPEVVQVLLTFNDRASAEIYEEFKDQGEHVYGIFEYPFGGNIDNRGVDRDFLGLRHQRDVNYSSARAPFYATSKKYGIYVESVSEGHYAIAQAGKTSFSFKDAQLKYDIIYGPSYADILNRYNTIAGPAFMPPAWAFGSIWWRDDQHHDLRDATNAQEKVIHDADRMRSLRIPAAAIWLDRPFGTGEQGWGNMDLDRSFPDPPRMVGDLNSRGIVLLVWIANRCWNQLFKEGSARGYVFFDNGSAADLRRPDAYNWFKDKLSTFVRLGVKGYKIDRGDEDEMPNSVENLNAILFAKMAGEGLETLNGKDYFMFARNANDTARKYTALWNGDTWAKFSSLEISIKNGLRSGVINFPMWGSDTGGYVGIPDKELFARWLEFSAFSPMMEVLIGPQRTIWYDYDDELVRIARVYVATHHDLIPYTRSYMYQASQTGMPIMRPLIFAYPADDKLSDTWDEYLYGREVLVAPVTTPNVTSRAVYLPAGRWMNYNDKSTLHEGPATVSAKAPLGVVPLFVREGAIIPRGDILKANNNWEENWAPKLHIEFFPSNRFSSQFNYFTGNSVETITASSVGHGIAIQFSDLGVSGTLEVYCRNTTGVTRNGVTLRAGIDYAYDPEGQKLSVPFTGATTLVIRGATSLFGP